MELNQVIIDKLYSEYLSNIIDEKLYSEILFNLSQSLKQKTVDKSPRLSNSELIKSPAFRVLKVYERLKLIKEIKGQYDTFGNMEIINLFPGLITYLLLTCFDQLGQSKSGHEFFPNWVSSKTKEKEHERNRITSKLNSEGINCESSEFLFSLRLYEEYHKIYGVKNSFVNFLKNILNKDQLKIFFDKIIIEDYKVTKDDYEFLEHKDIDAKIKWLFGLRNKYTHNLVSQETYFHHGYYGNPENFTLWEEVHSKEKVKRILVAESFKDEIENTVLIGITDYLKKCQD